MFSSLYLILSQLVFKKQTGTLLIKHEFTEWSRVILANGMIHGIEDSGTEGLAAGKKIAHKVSILTDFDEGYLNLRGYSERIDTLRYLSFLSKIEKLIRKIRKVIPENGAIFKTIASNWREENISHNELRIIISLDGQHTVRQIIKDLNLTELQVLYSIYNFYNKGLLKVVSTSSPMSMSVRKLFLTDLRRSLCEMIGGPAADILIQEAFENLKISPRLLSVSIMSELLSQIVLFLAPIERKRLGQWFKCFLDDLNDYETQNKYRLREIASIND